MSEKIHELKTWPEYFEPLSSGHKKHEIRVNDRDFKVGDYLRLREFVPDHSLPKSKPSQGNYTGRIMLVRVTFVTGGGEHGLPENLCVMSVK